MWLESVAVEVGGGITDVLLAKGLVAVLSGSAVTLLPTVEL